MPRGNRKKAPTVLDLVESVERTKGETPPSVVLELCARIKAYELTVRAQKEVIAEHARTIGRLRKGTQ